MRIWLRVGRSSSNAKFLAARLRAKYPPDAMTRHSVDRLPAPYQKFYNEWVRDSEPIHWVPRKVNWELHPRTGQVLTVRDRPIPVLYPPQSHDGIWGGEGVVDGLVKKGKYRCPVPKYWVPTLQRSVIYSEILDKYLSVVVTVRALRLIDEATGLDPYLLKTPANELKSLLALKLKRRLLLALVTRDFAHDDPKKQLDLLQKYKDYIIPVEDVEWYGLSIAEAKAKVAAQREESQKGTILPLKMILRKELIERLKAEKVEVQASGDSSSSPLPTPPSKSWLTKLNPFSKPETPQGRP